MFIGHFALGFAAKKIEPEMSLGTAFAAAQLCDLVWPVLVLAGVEHVAIAPGDTAATPLRFESYPWSHSLLMVAIWATLAAVAHFAIKRRPRAAFLIAALVLSHWVLDVATHRPDMPLTPGGAERLGMGLWHSVPATIAVETLMFALGVAAYVSATRARDNLGHYGLILIVLFLLAGYASAILGPPPPSVTAVVVPAAVLGPLLVLWAARLDRHRSPRQA
jgi:hypothetical protein